MSHYDIGSTGSGGGVTQSTGNFTPTIAFGGASVGVTYDIQYGRYVKTGLSVDIMIQISLSSKGSSTGVVSIGNLPFATSGESPAKWISVYVYNATYSSTSFTTLGAQLGANSTNVASIFQMPDSAILRAAMTNTNITDTSTVIISGTYWAAS